MLERKRHQVIAVEYDPDEYRCEDPYCLGCIYCIDYDDGEGWGDSEGDEMKPKLYFVRYPKLGRGFWRVSTMPYRSTKTIELWTFAHQIARDANRILEQEGKARP